MRVILWQSTTASTVVPCDAGYNFYYGETEDYLVEIMAAVPCAGQPDPVTISGPTAVCPSIDFTLNATGMTIGTGIEYQWQYDDNGTWTDIVGATNAFYTVTGGITTPTDYRFVTTCTNGGAQDISAAYSVAVNPATQCYCIPTYSIGCTDGDMINTFTLTGDNGTAFNDLNTGCSAGAYDDRTALPPVDLEIGQSYSGIVSSDYGSSNRVRFWIDFNDDGIFDNTTEVVGDLTNASTSGSPYTITIPATAQPGLHRMRARLVYLFGGSPSDIDPCSNMFDYGEVHDYMVNIFLPLPCSGMPTAGTATGPSSVLCSPASFNLNLSGYSSGTTGITIQWQYNDNGTW